MDEYWADVNPVVLGGRQPELPVLDEQIHPGLANTHTFVSRGQFRAKPLGSERWPVTRVPQRFTSSAARLAMRKERTRPLLSSCPEPQRTPGV